MVSAPRLLWLESEEELCREFQGIGIEPAEAVHFAAAAERRLVRLAGVPARLAAQLRQEMRALGGEAVAPTGTSSATDVILVGSPQTLALLCERLAGMPGQSAELADALSALLRNLARPPRFLAGRSCRLPLARPLIMGILNVTPDSFSDGGRFCSVESALRRGLELAAEGADLIDVGGESTRPGATPVSAQEEIDRVVPVIEALRREVALPLSVDTSKAAVASASVAAGAEFINDISGLRFDPEMAATAAATGAGLFLMHTRGRPDQMQAETHYADLLGEVVDYLQQGLMQAAAAGVPTEKLAVDPGIGFGKSAEGNLELLRRLPELQSLGRPVLLGTSRKSFIGRVIGRTEPEQRLAGTLATVALGVARGAQIFRVHDVRPARDAALMAWTVCRKDVPGLY
ncbi:MAG TPA: dihydropteroate synthase [Desulfuromonadales bacterium]|nr:dihydropteroate synthase [Desulfuromonadales bacterium]